MNTVNANQETYIEVGIFTPLFAVGDPISSLSFIFPCVPRAFCMCFSNVVRNFKIESTHGEIEDGNFCQGVCHSRLSWFMHFTVEVSKTGYKTMFPSSIIFRKNYQSNGAPVSWSLLISFQERLL